MMLQLVTNDGAVVESEEFAEDSWDYDAALRGIAYARVLNRVNHEPSFSTNGDMAAAIDAEVRKIAGLT